MIINCLKQKAVEMKKLTYVFAALVMAAALGSCQQDDSEIVLKKADTQTEATTPASDAGINPVIITGANNGGNVTCSEVASYFQLPAGYFYCGDKVDYNNGMFAGEFPDGLTVNVTDGVYVAFETEAPLVIEGIEYIVGAVIVKGGNNANVYYYPGGSMGDFGLAAPVNKSGKPAGLSNLTFCLVKANPIVIALKTYLATPLQDTYTAMGWAVSGGLGVSTDPGLHMGYNYYDFNGENEFDLVKATIPAIEGVIGTIKANDYWEGDNHFLEVVLNLDDENLVFANTYLYVGSLKGYEGRWYEAFPFKAEGDYAAQRVFRINFNQITL